MSPQTLGRYDVSRERISVFWRWVGRVSLSIFFVSGGGALALAAQVQSAGSPQQQSSAPPGQAAVGADAGVPGYVIGPADVLSIGFWGEKDLSADVVVRSDGKISLPLLNDVQAAGLTPAELRTDLQRRAAKFVQDPVATVVVKEVNSRKVFVTGMVDKAGAYPLNTPMTVLQLIATAGGFKDFANTKNVMVVRTTGGKKQYFKFNYQDVVHGKRGTEDIQLEPGDTVVVP